MIDSRWPSHPCGRYLISDMKFSKKCAIVGNAGSGKTTLAKKIREQTGARILDLDNITWERGRLQKRRPIEDSIQDMQKFIEEDPENFIIEGCYGELIESSLKYSPMLIFLDPGVSQCLENCRNRKWESHKYSSKEEQDKFLQFLLTWVPEYYRREGPMSHLFHQKIFDEYIGEKMILSKLK
ncbi:MAG: shikimate kinase [Deltaproteobacteria bacterium]|nr:shikimate kinase [Deltaproteobacteria bacterium]